MTMMTKALARDLNRVFRGSWGSHGKIEQNRNELEKMMQLVMDAQPKVVVEIGSFRGWSMYLWGRCLNEPAELISIDSLSRRVRRRPLTVDYKEMPARVAPHSFTLIKGSSHAESSKESVQKVLNGRPIDFLFIDGDHTYEGVKQDYEMYAPMVDGIVALHDIATDSCGVPRYWAELKKNVQYEEIIDNGSKLGIGVIRRSVS